MNEWIDRNGLVVWGLIGFVIWIDVVRQIYKSEDYRSWWWVRRRFRELAMLLLSFCFGPLTLIFASFMISEGIKWPEPEPEFNPAPLEFEDDVEEVAVGIMLDSVVLCGDDEVITPVLRRLVTSGVKNPVEAMESLQRWSIGMSDSHLALLELFKPEGAMIGTYVYGKGGFEITPNVV